MQRAVQQVTEKYASYVNGLRDTSLSQTLDLVKLSQSLRLGQCDIDAPAHNQCTPVLGATSTSKGSNSLLGCHKSAFKAPASSLWRQAASQWQQASLQWSSTSRMGNAMILPEPTWPMTSIDTRRQQYDSHRESCVLQCSPPCNEVELQQCLTPTLGPLSNV
jgi:hypothetical protein